jgi:surface polysaccharide O-acyltransferase-like enzyme
MLEMIPLNLREIVYYKAICMLAVLFIHTTSVATRIGLDGLSLYMITFVNRGLQWAVPAFIMISAFIHIYLYMNRDITSIRWLEFFRKRLLTILIPYLVFSILYFLYREWTVSQYITYFDAIKGFIKKIITGKAYFHLYFVIIITQFYLIFPILLKAVQKWRWLLRHALWLGVVIHVLLTGAHLLWNWRQTDSFIVEFLYKLSPYIIYIAVGVWLAGAYDRIKSSFSAPFANVQHKIQFFAFTLWLVLSCIAFVWLHLNSSNFNSDWVPYIREVSYQLFIIPAIIFILYASFFLENIRHQQWTTWIYGIGIRSFGIYLIHPFILIFYREWIPAPGNTVMYAGWLVVCFAVATVLSYAIVELLYRKVKVHPYLIGQVVER